MASPGFISPFMLSMLVPGVDFNGNLTYQRPFDNGAIAVAEASFSAVYGYDIRGEVFGSAGMVSMGEGAVSSMRHYAADGRHADTVLNAEDVIVLLGEPERLAAAEERLLKGGF